MRRRKRLEITALVGLLAQIAFTAGAFVLWGQTGSLALLAQAWFFAPGVLLWAVVFLQGRQRRRAHDEREEVEELRRKRLSEELFEDQQVDRLREHSALVVFERFAVPGFSIVLAGLLGFLCYRNIHGALLDAGVQAVREPLQGVVGLSATFFLALLLGKYCVALAQDVELRLLRAAGSYMLGNAASALLVVVSLVMVKLDSRLLEAVMAYAVPGAMGLIAVEIVLNMVLDIYRPRIPGQETRPPYDSRLLGLIGQPGGMVKTIAATLDYQFGFKVSETWFYRFMGRAIIPLLAVQVLALWALSALAIVRPGEAAFIERWGDPILRSEDADKGLKASLLEPGLYLKAPWPMDVLRRVPAYEIFREEIGKIKYTEGERARSLPEGVLRMTDPNYRLWNEVHVDLTWGYEANFLVPISGGSEEKRADAPDANISRVEAYVHYRLKRDADGNPDANAAYDYYYGQATPAKLVDSVANAAMCRLAARQDFLRWINVDRERVSEEFREIVQDSLDDLDMGLEVVYAGIPVVHPPAETSEAYEGVINAYEQMESLIHQAHGEEAMIKAVAQAQQARLVDDAEIYSNRVTGLAVPQAKRFAIQMKAYRIQPEVYRYRQYLNAVQEVLQGHRVYLVPRRDEEVMLIDMSEEQTDIFSIDVQKSFEVEKESPL